MAKIVSESPRGTSCHHVMTRGHGRLWINLKFKFGDIPRSKEKERGAEGHGRGRSLRDGWRRDMICRGCPYNGRRSAYISCCVVCWGFWERRSETGWTVGSWLHLSATELLSLMFSHFPLTYNVSTLSWLIWVYFRAIFGTHQPKCAQQVHREPEINLKVVKSKAEVLPSVKNTNEITAT